MPVHYLKKEAYCPSPARPGGLSIRTVSLNLPEGRISRRKKRKDSALGEKGRLLFSGGPLKESRPQEQPPYLRSDQFIKKRMKEAIRAVSLVPYERQGKGGGGGSRVEGREMCGRRGGGDLRGDEG